MDAVSNDLANVSTAGFKGSHRAFRDLVYVGDGVRGFTAALDTALAEAADASPERAPARRAMASLNTWSQRVDAYATVLDE
jgi:flagellar basal body rod protein FlgF